MKMHYFEEISSIADQDAMATGSPADMGYFNRKYWYEFGTESIRLTNVVLPALRKKLKLAKQDKRSTKQERNLIRAAIRATKSSIVFYADSAKEMLEHSKDRYLEENTALLLEQERIAREHEEAHKAWLEGVKLEANKKAEEFVAWYRKAHMPCPTSKVVTVGDKEFVLNDDMQERVARIEWHYGVFLPLKEAMDACKAEIEKLRKELERDARKREIEHHNKMVNDLLEESRTAEEITNLIVNDTINEVIDRIKKEKLISLPCEHCKFKENRLCSLCQDNNLVKEAIDANLIALTKPAFENDRELNDIELEAFEQFAGSFYSKGKPHARWYFKGMNEEERKFFRYYLVTTTKMIKFMYKNLDWNDAMHKTRSILYRAKENIGTAMLPFSKNNIEDAIEHEINIVIGIEKSNRTSKWTKISESEVAAAEEEGKRVVSRIRDDGREDFYIVEERNKLEFIDTEAMRMKWSHVDEGEKVDMIEEMIADNDYFPDKLAYIDLMARYYKIFNVPCDIMLLGMKDSDIAPFKRKTATKLLIKFWDCIFQQLGWTNVFYKRTKKTENDEFSAELKTFDVKRAMKAYSELDLYARAMKLGVSIADLS